MNAVSAAAVADQVDRLVQSSEAPPTPISVEMRTEIVTRLLKSSDSALDAAAVSDDKTLREDLGLASIDSLELALDLEEDYGVILEDGELFQLRTVGDLMMIVAAKLPSRPKSA